jgi:hypothetical protein
VLLLETPFFFFMEACHLRCWKFTNRYL